MKGIAVEIMVTPKRFDEEIVHGKPDWAAPIGVSSEHFSLRFGGFVADGVVDPTDGQTIGRLAVHFGKRSNAEGGEEFFFVEDSGEDADEAL